MKWSRLVCSLGLGILLIPSYLCAQAEDPPTTATQAPEPIDKRIAGILPNYRTADGTQPFEPIPAKRKLAIAAKDSFDKPIYVLAGFFTAIDQADNTDPSLGQGLKGFGARYIRNFGTSAIGNMLTEGVLPAVLHDDPRYFRVGPGYGGGMRRTYYALTRVLVNKSDRGRWRLNASELAGNAAAVAIATSYYPDSQGWRDNIGRFWTQVGIDAASNVMKEFWPDVKKKMQARRQAKAPAQP